MKRLFVLSAMLFLVLSTSAFADRNITLATLDWQPYVGSDMKNYGFNAEIITEALKQVGYTVNIEFMPWDDVISKTRQGLYDGAFPEYYSKERSENFVYSSFFSNSLLGFYKRKESNITYKTLHDLKPYKIGIVTGYINTEEFDSATYLKKVESDSDLESLKKLISGEVDLIIIDKLVAQYIIRNDLPEAAGRLEFVDPPLVIHPLFLILPKKLTNSEQIKNDFNKGFDIISHNGTVDAIMKRSGLK